MWGFATIHLPCRSSFAVELEEQMTACATVFLKAINLRNSRGGQSFLLQFIFQLVRRLPKSSNYRTSEKPSPAPKSTVMSRRLRVFPLR
jgi:hypothetical protein